MRLTAAGRRMISDPEATRSALARAIGGSREFDRMVVDIADVVLRAHGEIDADAPREVVTPMVAEQGWRTDGAGCGPRDAPM